MFDPYIQALNFQSKKKKKMIGQQFSGSNMCIGWTKHQHGTKLILMDHLFQRNNAIKVGLQDSECSNK